MRLLPFLIFIFLVVWSIGPSAAASGSGRYATQLAVRSAASLHSASGLSATASQRLSAEMLVDSLEPQQLDTLDYGFIRAEIFGKGKPHSPLRASLLSAVLPGAGQVYNKRWWKAPIVWAGVGGLTGLVIWNNRRYQSFRRDYRYRVDGDPLTVDSRPLFSDVSLKLGRDTYQRQTEISAIVLGVFYLLNIVDAFVDGHLHDFDVSDDMSFQLSIEQGNALASSPQYSIGLGFKVSLSK